MNDCNCTTPDGMCLPEGACRVDEYIRHKEKMEQHLEQERRIVEREEGVYAEWKISRDLESNTTPGLDGPPSTGALIDGVRVDFDVF